MNKQEKENVSGICRAAMAVAMAGLIAAGCGSYDGDKVRREHAEQYRAAATETTLQELVQKEPLDLDECVEIALRNSFATRLAEIDARIATLDRKIAFANFLPTVELSGEMYSIDRQPMRKAQKGPLGKPIYMPVQDKCIRKAALEIQMPIFTPSAWFLYAARQRGEEIGELMKDFTRQRIRLEVTAQYYDCLATSEAARTARSRVAAAEQLLAEVEAMRKHDLVDDLQLEQARTLLLSEQTNSDILEREAENSRADLMTLMGLMPTRGCRLEEGKPLEPPAGELEDMIVQALLNQPMLKVADRSVEINRQMVKMAIADFLPNIVGFGVYSYTSDSYIKYSNTLTAGLAGVMTVFNGFANVNRYKAAREREKAAWLQREELCLAVILQVIRARSALEDADRQMALAEKNLGVAEKNLANVKATWREGLTPTSELLEAISMRDAAEETKKAVSYYRQVCIAALRHALGESATSTNEKGKKDEG